MDELNRELAELDQRSGGPKLQEARQALVAEMEWVRSSQFQSSPGIPIKSRSYFNTGCCSFGDGDVTGLEIEGGKVRLVRWPNSAGAPLPEVLEEADLRKRFEEIRASSGAAEGGGARRAASDLG